MYYCSVGLVVCVALLLTTSVTAQEKGWDNVIVQYDEMVNLTCENAMVNWTTTPGWGEIMWIIPNGEILSLNGGYISKNERAEIQQQGKMLVVRKIDDPDFGKYYCLARTGAGPYMLVQKGINVDGAYYGDLMAKYQMNLIIGASAAACLLVLIISLCALYNLRYRNSSGDREKFIGDNGYDNAIEMNEDDESRKVNDKPAIYDEKPTFDGATRL